MFCYTSLTNNASDNWIGAFVFSDCIAYQRVNYTEYSRREVSCALFSYLFVFAAQAVSPLA